MPKNSSPKPTDGELNILRVLWRRGPSTVRDVYEELNPGQETGYTNVLKMMQIMTDKGLLTRDESARSHVYAAKFEATVTQRQIVGDLMDRVFDGSARNLVMQALSTRRATAGELAEIRRLLDQIEGETP